MQKLLEYQKLDMKKRKIEQEILDCEDRKNAKNMQNKLKEFQQRIFDLETSAGAVIAKFEAVNDAIAKLEKEIEKQGADLKTVEANNVQSKILNIKKLKDNLLRLEKELTDIQKVQEQIVKDNAYVMKNAVVANKNMAVYKERYNQVKASRSPELEEIAKQMQALEKEVDKNILAKYKVISETKPLPVFVELKDGKCAGCRMEVPIATVNLLKQKGFLECENCGRIIFYVK